MESFSVEKNSVILEKVVKAGIKTQKLQLSYFGNFNKLTRTK